MQSTTHYHLYFMAMGAIQTSPGIATMGELRVTKPFSSREAAREAAPEERRYITEEMGIPIDSMSIRHCSEGCAKQCTYLPCSRVRREDDPKDREVR